jgi:hypothetical protein
MRNYINSPLDLRTRCYMPWGGSSGGDPGAKNREREAEGKRIADAALAKQRAEAAALERKGLASANELWERILKESEYYKAAQASYGDTYKGDLEFAIDQYSGAASGITDFLYRAVEDYRGRSENIATKSADEAWNWNRSKVDEFVSLADTLSQAAFDTRQRLIADTNPYQLAQQQQASKNNLDLLSGRMPADVLAAQQRASAQMAIQGGFGAGSAMGLANSARNFGLTSMDLMQFGDQSSRDWAKTIYDTQIAGLQVTPGNVYDNSGLKTEQVFAVNQQNNLGLLSAQQDIGNKSFNVVRDAFATRAGAYKDIYSGMSNMRSLVYQGITGGARNVADLKNAVYTNAANIASRGISDWGAQRSTVNYTAWQNELQQIADRNRQNANNITGLTTAIGGLAGGLLTGGNPVGFAAGASLGGALGGTMVQNPGGGNYASSVVGSDAWRGPWAKESNLGNVWDSITGLAGYSNYADTFGSAQTGFRNTPGFASNAAMQNATVSGTTGSGLPSLGGWVPKATK